MPNEDTSQSSAPTPESVAPSPEVAPVAGTEIPAPADPAQMPSEPITPAAPETQTAQMGRNEPLPAEPEPFDSAQNRPLPQQQPASQPSVPASVVAPIANLGRDVLAKARATIQNRKRKKLDKILEAITRKGKITNDEVEKLLHVSDATATRYLSALEKEGKIKQVGKTGKAVEYIRI